jgi:diphthamide biosynthesis methyltransferase
VPTTADGADRRHVAEYEALAERAYDDMYDSRSPAACYSDLKDYFGQAIAAARRAGLDEEAARLMARLDHCKQVYRKQFSAF